MVHKENSSKAAEYLRQVIPLLAQQKLPSTPQNYSIFYNYIAGSNQALVEAIDSNIKKSNPFSNDLLNELHEKYVNGSSTIEKQEDIQSSLAKVISSASSEVLDANSDANTFDASLNKHASALSSLSDPDATALVLKQILADTRQMVKNTNLVQLRMQETTAEIEKLKVELNSVKAIAEKDALTGLKNRGAFDKEIKACLAEKTAERLPTITVMLDIDHFKRINDSFGHLVGDRVIRYVAALLTQVIGPDNFIARYGGEEFVLILKNQTTEVAFQLCEKIRTAMGNSKLQRKGSGETIGKVTLSAGIATQKAGDNVNSLISRTDSALYEAKNSGRNKTVVND